MFNTKMLSISALLIAMGTLTIKDHDQKNFPNLKVGRLVKIKRWIWGTDEKEKNGRKRDFMVKYYAIKNR